jgi:hypothetical protein
VSKGGLGGALYTCFVDFRKAFDCIARRLIWKRLFELGIRGNMLCILQNIYKNTCFQVKVNCKISSEYVVTVSGVKQGCPLSPLLFGLFIEQLHIFLRERCPDIGVLIVSEEKLGEVLYADDTTLMTWHPGELQNLCDALAEFCRHVGMEVNVSKTEMVVFHSPRMGRQNVVHDFVLTYKGEAVVQKSCFKYLGVPLHATRWTGMAAIYLGDRAGKAMWALLRKFKTLQIYSLKVKVQMFVTLVASVGNYGCQVWGVNYLRMDRECHIFNNPMQKLTFNFARIITGASQSVSRWILLKELDLLPVQCHWATACVKFWNDNSCIDMRNTVVYAAMEDDARLFCEGNDTCWCAKLFICLSALDLTGGLSVQALRRHGSEFLMRMKFSTIGVRKRIIEHYKTFSDMECADPRTAPSRGVALVRHSVWFEDTLSRCLYLSAPEAYLKVLMRFRMGCSPLRIHDHRLTRTDRVCTLCVSQCLEDEKHVLFECSAYRDLRRHPKWCSLFEVATQDMKPFMNQERQYDVAVFLYTLFKVRQSRMDTSVAWNLDTFSSSDDEA